MNDREAIRELAYQAAGAASIPFMQDHPDYVMPTERISEAVERVLADLAPHFPAQKDGGDG